MSYQPVSQGDPDHGSYATEPESCWIQNKLCMVSVLTSIMTVFYVLMTGYGADQNNGWYTAGGLLGLLVTGVSYVLYRRSHRRQEIRDEFVHELSSVITHMETQDSIAPQS